MKNVNFVPKGAQAILIRIQNIRKSIMKRRYSIKKQFLKISQCLQKNICVRDSFFTKMQAFKLATLLKRDSYTGVFL